MPLYDTKIYKRGPSPVFVSKVKLDKNIFVGPISKSKKEAEQNAARVAINSLLSVKEHVKVTEKNPPVLPRFSTMPQHFIVNNKTCKSILKEYGQKKKCQAVPSYNTYAHKSGAPPPKFVSFVSFEGKMYHGPVSKSKKEAEQAAARVAIDSILGNPFSRMFMLEAMQPKIK